MKVALLILVIIAYLYYTIRAQRRIVKSRILPNKTKIVNSILIWIIPFVWFYMMEGFIEHENIIVTKAVRDKRKKENESPFYDGGFFG